MTTMHKQLRRKHRKAAKPQRRAQHPSHATGLSRLQALEPAYTIWRARTVERGQAHADWNVVHNVLELYAAFEPLESPDALVPHTFNTLLNVFRQMPADEASLAMDRIDGYLHFLKDTGRWHRGTDLFDLLHGLVLTRVPGRRSPTTSYGCLLNAHLTNSHGIALVQWATYLINCMLEGRFDPRNTEPLALSVQDPEGTNMLAPGLYPIPFPLFTDLFSAMQQSFLVENQEYEGNYDAEEEASEEYVGQRECSMEPCPTHLGMALLEDHHPQNHEAIRRLLTAFLTIRALSYATPIAGMAGLRRAKNFMSVLVKVANQPSTALAHGEASMLSLGHNCREELAEQYGDISSAILTCLQGGILESHRGGLVAQPVVCEAIKDLQDAYAA